MLRVADRLGAGGSGAVAGVLDRGGSLAANPNVTEEGIDDFLSDYELLNAIHRHNLINRDEAYDAFPYDLEKR